MSGRKGLVGPGYMPKGGKGAAMRHNAQVRAREAAPAPAATIPVPETADVRTDVRASARSAVRWTERVEDAAIGAGSSFVTFLVLEWLVR